MENISTLLFCPHLFDPEIEVSFTWRQNGVHDLTELFQKHERGLHLLPASSFIKIVEITFLFDAPCARIREMSNLISESSY